MHKIFLLSWAPGPRRARILHDGLARLGALPRAAQRVRAIVAEGRQMEQRIRPETAGRVV